MYASFCSGNEGVLKRFVKDDFEDAKVQLEDDCILPALHDLIDYSTPPACSDAFPQSSGRSPRRADKAGQANLWQWQQFRMLVLQI